MRAIEGENPLYLLLAKIYEGAFDLNPGIEIFASDENNEFGIQRQIRRLNDADNAGETSTGTMTGSSTNWSTT